MFRKVNRRTYRRGFRVAGVAAAFATLAAGGPLAAPADAQALPPSLAGENFLAQDGDGGGITTIGQVEISGDCTPTVPSQFTLSYTASGPATGPYPGTFTESGTLTANLVSDGGFFVFGLDTVVTWTANFTIDSPVGDVTGTKTQTTVLGSTSYCQNPPAHYVSAGSQLTYQATIETPDGRFIDQGDSRAYVQELTCSPFGACGPVAFNNEHFDEQFFTSTGVVPAPTPATVVLAPPTAINTVGTSHTVTATVTNTGGSPSQGYPVLFTVLGSVNTTGSCTTNSLGTCTFTYAGPSLPGADLITGCADSNRNGSVDPGEPCGEATKIWIIPVTMPGQVTGGGWIDPSSGRVSFGFNAQSNGTTVKGNCNVIDHPTKTQIKCKSVTSLVVVGTHATFFGQATLNGVATDYRIDVDDLGEPGTADTFKIQTGSGYSAAGTLRGGNIQIHR